MATDAALRSCSPGDAAGNPCILKLSEGLPATSKLLLDLIPKYFDPRSVTAVTGSKEEVTELLKLPFDFVFFTCSVKVGKIVMEAAAKNLTPILLELADRILLSLDPTRTSRMRPRKLSGAQQPGWTMVHLSWVRLCARIDC